jgi:hypothetical protein
VHSPSSWLFVLRKKFLLRTGKVPESHYRPEGVFAGPLRPKSLCSPAAVCASIRRETAKMRLRPFAFVVVLGLLVAAMAFCQEIPEGTVFPIMSSATVDSAKSKPGDRFTGKLMQDVILPSGERIRSGAKIQGQVVESSGPSATAGTRLVVRFDRLVGDGKQFPISVSLRALASMEDVFNAQLPVGTFDEYGTSISDWTTVQVGGAAVYLGDGTVRDAMEIVGRAPGWGIVTGKLIPAPKRGCAANSLDSEREQSLWVFSPWACGAYGFDDLKIAHHGVTTPVGSIELTAPTTVHVRGGSGWLLRVVSARPDTNDPPAK